MKNQTELLDHLSKLMGKVDSGETGLDSAAMQVKIAEVMVNIAKVEATIFAASNGTMLPEFMAVNHQPHPLTPDELAQERERQRIAANKAARIERQGRA